ncbi:hypothetical protein AB6A40_005950 [Gnathostoma spinigerum]|uniref:SHSP domain-containing protein n=1 Tax=Gnathostoma spinigerum TaxID=75299 RepID=A0ABD6EP82_9BILA
MSGQFPFVGGDPLPNFAAQMEGVRRNIDSAMQQVQATQMVNQSFFPPPPPPFLNVPIVPNPPYFGENNTVTDEKDKFSIEFSVSGFRLEDIKIFVEGNELMIKGDHLEYTATEGRNERHFSKKFTLPNGVDTQRITSELDERGILRVTVPKIAV